MTLPVDDLSKELPVSGPRLGIVETIPRHGLYRQVFKRLFDIAAVSLSSVVVLPLVALMALLVSLDGSNPFYLNDRVGRGGRVFRMLKLRTMVPNADALLESYLNSNPEARLEWNSTQKLKSDPRITRVGWILRKTSLDELPQLWNVLTGEMSIVGPRPMMPSQRAIYSGTAYYYLRPGLTGPWQISDRNEGEFSRRVEFDRVYDRELSFSNDLRIIVATVGVVIRGTGY
ncbi:MAG: sugar transferase [Defluviimonas sp.]|uniref:sugar transferase n=1 Tax=Albidovulum sp. TaxID=1872424 RepID=UPI002A33D7EB|nr:sugar transferase [Defluviimonas sp.]